MDCLRNNFLSGSEICWMGKCVSLKIFFNGSLHETSHFLICPHNYFEPCYIEIVVNLNKFFAGYIFGPITESEITY